MTVLKVLPILVLCAAANDDASRPIERVVTLLQKMLKDTQREAEKDAALYKKMDCWCSSNSKEKSAAVAAAQKKIAQLQTDIEAGVAVSAQLAAEIEHLEAEVVKHSETLAEATSVRAKENQEFTAQNREVVEAIGQLDAAIGKLKKFHSKKEASEAFLQVQGVVRTLHSSRFSKTLQGDLLDVMAAFPAPRRSVAGLAQQPIFSSYNAKSAEIYGVLGQLKEQMEKDAGAAYAEEKRMAAMFASLKTTKEAEIKVCKDQIGAKNADLSDTKVQLANDKHDLEDTRGALSADQQFILDLQEKCSGWDESFSARSKTRSEELTAINEAIKILTDDTARDTFSRSLKATSFLQFAHSDRRQRAAAVLRAAAHKGGSAELLVLTGKVQLDAFTKVKEAMDKMVAQMKKQQAAEAKKQDYCRSSLSDNEDDRNAKKSASEDLEQEIGSLESHVEELSASLASLNEDVATTRSSMKKAGEDRAEQNKLFQSTVQDHRATVHILDMALQKLEKFYAPGVRTFLQRQPEDFKNYKRHGAAPAVMELLRMVQSDCKAADSIAVKDEQKAQAAYATFISDSNAAVNASLQAIVDKKEAKAKAETARLARKQDLEATTQELQDLKKTNSDLHRECDFLLKNYEVRQAARQTEMDAVATAKAILSGADFD